MTNQSMSRVTALSLLDAYASAQEEGQTRLKSCLWNLNKARRQKGNHDSISALDVREELRAHAVLQQAATPPSLITEDASNVKQEQEENVLTLVDVTEIMTEDKENTAKVKVTTGLRNRKKSKVGDSTEAAATEWTEEAVMDEEQLLRTADPIDLFGALPPRDLRTAQAEAKKALQSYVDAANLAAAILKMLPKD